jgi:hypothetical protein
LAERPAVVDSPRCVQKGAQIKIERLFVAERFCFLNDHLVKEKSRLSDFLFDLLEAHRTASITRLIAGCLRFFTLTQCFDLPA